MRPIFVPNFITVDLFETLRDEVAWVNRSSPRDECFMADVGAPRKYSYGNSNEHRSELHTYTAVDMHPQVQKAMDYLNYQHAASYNVCVLNYYKDQHQHLGWHADDSPEQDLEHPISVISFGAERYIFVKHVNDKGEVPADRKFLLTKGSLFTMPGGFQAEHRHRIPKHDRECGGRISLTFRKLVR